METALIQSEQAYRTLFENMPIGLYRTSADGRILDANPALVKMFGYPDSSSLLAMNARDLYADPASNDRFKDEVLNKSVPFAFESEYKRYDHKSFWAEDYVHIIYDKEGSPLYYEGSLINITDRKLAEKALTESEKQYRLLAEGMADVVWVLDVKNMKFKYVSPSVQKLLGYTAEEMLDMSMEELIVSYSMEQINANFPDRLARFIQGDPMVVTEMSTVDQWRKDGSLVSTENATTLVRNEKMEIEAIGYRVIFPSANGLRMNCAVQINPLKQSIMSLSKCLLMNKCWRALMV
ncbi:PAS domain-containing protein [Candidatus Villigracilis proximus]|uniref:PAS domain-containing protein n=1 Tax=Candidatus Villigracilis proximus TaxID=3140683 RepID=UPI0031EF3E0B